VTGAHGFTSAARLHEWRARLGGFRAKTREILHSRVCRRLETRGILHSRVSIPQIRQPSTTNQRNAFSLKGTGQVQDPLRDVLIVSGDGLETKIPDRYQPAW